MLFRTAVRLFVNAIGSKSSIFQHFWTRRIDNIKLKSPPSSSPASVTGYSDLLLTFGLHGNLRVLLKRILVVIRFRWQRLLMHQRRRRLLRFDDAKSGRLRDTSARKVERTHPYRGVLLLHFHHRARNKLDHFPLTTILPPLYTTSAPRSRSVFHHHGVNQPFTLRLLFIIYEASNEQQWYTPI